jgi:hypothetical protein
MKLKCINSKTFNLTEGKEYDVKFITNAKGIRRVSVINDAGRSATYSTSLFTLEVLETKLFEKKDKITLFNNYILKNKINIAFSNDSYGEVDVIIKSILSIEEEKIEISNIKNIFYINESQSSCGIYDLDGVKTLITIIYKSLSVNNNLIKLCKNYNLSDQEKITFITQLVSIITKDLFINILKEKSTIIASLNIGIDSKEYSIKKYKENNHWFINVCIYINQFITAYNHDIFEQAVINPNSENLMWTFLITQDSIKNKIK